VFTPEDIEHNMRWIWGFGHNLLVVERNPFQELLLGALIHFSKSMLKSDTSERLMYVITALEDYLCERASLSYRTSANVWPSFRVQRWIND
jgi:hypothetical protein